MRIQIYAHKRDNVGGSLEVDWAKLTQILTTHRRGIKDGVAWVPADVDGERRKENVSRVNFAVFDLDEDAPEVPITRENFTAILSRVEDSGVAAIVYSTHSYTESTPKCRITFKLSRSVLPNEWPRVRDGIQRMFGIYADPSTKDPCRLYYLPAAAPGAPIYSAVSDGTDSIDVDHVLANVTASEAPAATAGMLSASMPTAATSGSAVLDHASLVRVLEQEAGPATGKHTARSTLADYRDNNGSWVLENVRRRLKAYTGASRDLISKVYNGEPLATEGGRDNAIHAVCLSLAACYPLEMPTEVIFQLLKVSTDPLGDREEGGTWSEYAFFKLSRSREGIKNTRVAQARVAGDFLSLAREEASRTSGFAGDGSTSAEEVTEQYSESQLARWAHEQRCGSVAELSKRWILLVRDLYYVFKEGRYQPPLPKEAAALAVLRDLARSPVKVVDGLGAPIPFAQILIKHCTVALRATARLDIPFSYYDAETTTFHEAVAHVRPSVRPIHHPEIHQWLTLLGGRYSEQLLDWVATVTELSRQNPAVYLEGRPGCGKTLLAMGLARLWTDGGPSRMNMCLDGFNDTLTNCPLVVADEKLPDRPGITAELREFIGSSERTLNRKFQSSTSLRGAIRVIIMANNDRLLETNEEMSVNDVEAVSGRFLHLQPDPNTTAYLLSLGGPPVCDTWIKEDKLAEHALWLRDNRKIDRSRRFLVESVETEFHQKLATQNGLAGLVAEFLIKGLQSGLMSDMILVGEGHLWVNPEYIANPMTWETRMGKGRPSPSAGRVGHVLRLLSQGRVEAVVNNVERSYYMVKTDSIMAQARRLAIGDVNALAARIAAPCPTIANNLHRVGPVR